MFGVSLQTQLAHHVPLEEPGPDKVVVVQFPHIYTSPLFPGRGRITPAASTVDLQYGEKSLKSQLNTLQDVEVINEEGEGAKVEEPQGRKNIIPRTRYSTEG